MCAGLADAGAHPTSLQKRKMLLSALIPVYNYDCMAFVRSLSRQMQACGIDGEIVVADDGSAAACKAANKDLENVQFCRYIEFEANRGRAAIRNALADMARGEYLLFMDCDAMPPDDLFLSRYADCRTELICAHAAVSGAGPELCAALLAAPTTDACLELLEQGGLRAAVIGRLLAAISSHLQQRAGDLCQAGALLFSNQYGLLGLTDTAKEILAQWKP